MKPPAGTIALAGKQVSRLGLGTMRLTGPGTWGDPIDLDAAAALLREAVHEHGITHIDTADAYGPHTVEHLVRDVLHPYPERLLIATKVGMLRTGPNEWTPHGHPAYLRASVEGSLRRLGVDCLDLCYLHRNDPQVPFLDQVGALATLQKEGKIAHVGLSKVSPTQIGLAATIITVAAVQNKLNEAQPSDARTATYCRTKGIPYIPYAPLGTGALAQNGGAPKALRWLLDLGKNVAPIPGTSDPAHLREIVGSLS